MWTREWDSVEFFGFHIRQEYWEADKSILATSAWATRMNLKLHRGRSILANVRDVLTLELPSDQSEVADIWRQAYDLIAQLHRGIALLEAWLEVTRAR
jgi:hypothetical protein